jgi:4-amino-4-deoxy-L-arabinose transferase-like glycosyltransferase
MPRHQGIRWVLAAASLAALLRLPFVFTGLSTDEGGYAYVAQQWSRGARLYDTAWLDRPQGLLLTYRALLAIDDSGWTIRAGMVLAGVLITIALGAIGWMLSGRAAGILASFGYAVIGVAPHLEGITLNGELLASVPSTISIALLVRWWRRSDSWWWLAGAGLFAGLALTMKQSGIDGVVVGLVVLVIVRRLSALVVFAGSVAVPLVASVLHGIAVGWSHYWTALVGYQLSAQGGSGSNIGTRLSDFSTYAGSVAIDLALVLVVSCFGWRALDRGGRWMFGAWLFAGFVGINLGGSYWPHYYMQPLPALVLLAAFAVVSWRSVRWQRVVGALLVLPTLVWLIALVPMSAQRRSRTIPYDALARRDDRIAAFVDATTAPGDKVYVLWSEAYLYFAAQRVSPYPYLWGKPIQKIPAALPQLRDMLAGADRPVLVILDTPPPAADPSGGIADVLAAHYHPETTVDGVPILRAN